MCYWIMSSSVYECQKQLPYTYLIKTVYYLTFQFTRPFSNLKQWSAFKNLIFFVWINF